ncbi:hypothetical protein D6V68_23055 [Escherichia albertii]|nr:hypothetical protein [Escherichia albertii]EFJ2289066.1 hypothetical protein [Escherichia albertii]EFO0112140.1 hypothetical protein [Escherichia albertii]MLY53853.1 hypothetical protein [Escherichia albertii]
MSGQESVRRISAKPEFSGEAQCCGGLIPGGVGCWKEKTPARCRYSPDNITGANLEPKQLKNSRETVSLQCMGPPHIAIFVLS